MIIKIEKYNSEWVKQFIKRKTELQTILQEYKPVIEHIGSTSVPNLAAKPIIDIAIGIKSIDLLDETIEPMKKNGFIHISAYNIIMPERRFFVGLKDNSTKKFNSDYSKINKIPHDELHENKNTHIHVWEHDSKDWIRHIALRDYLGANENIKKHYEKLKLNLSTKNWLDGNEYNNAKNDFIQAEETNAINWYKNNLIKGSLL